MATSFTSEGKTVIVVNGNYSTDQLIRLIRLMQSGAGPHWDFCGKVTSKTMDKCEDCVGKIKCRVCKEVCVEGPKKDRCVDCVDRVKCSLCYKIGKKALRMGSVSRVLNGSNVPSVTILSQWKL